MENMKMRKQNSALGFTLVELMVSMAVGLIALAAMASLFKAGMNSAMLVTQRAETQQNMRTAMDLMTKDISMAGAGLPQGGIQLPTGAGSSTSKYGCDQTTTCHVPNGTYPNPNFLYYIIPGYKDGVEGSAIIPAAPAPAINDSVTVAYADLNYPLFEYNVAFVAGSNPIAATFTAPVGVTLPAITQSGAGYGQAIQAGDLIMFEGGSFTAIGEATSVSSAAGVGTIKFANGDPLNINQSGAASNTLNQLAGSLGAGGVAYRVWVVTYYLTVPPAGQTPRLMRQVNGLAPVPVADDIINLQFAYDNFNNSTDALDANQANPLGAGESPNNIQKVNLVVMGQSIVNDGNSQNLYLATSVSASNMAYTNPY